MTQIGEGVQPPGKELAKDEAADKKPIRIRIHLFFDGTLNNRVNIEAREQKLAAYDEQSNKTDDSYENGRTNIAIMEEQVLTSCDGYDHVLKVYTEGPGTVNLGADAKIGYGMGGGDTGVKSKVQAGITNAINELISKNLEVDLFYVEKLSLDVFGFSRGAAGARYCVHQLIKTEKLPFKQRVMNLGLDVKEDAVEVKFAGLYDTVASYWLGQILHTDNWRLELKSIALAKCVVHLVAAEEHRKNFPLHNIKSAVSAGIGKEYFLPGVHSDVGGSYNQAHRGEYEKETDVQKKRAMLMGSDEMIINIDSPSNIEQDRNYLINQGWYRPHEIWSEVRSTDDMGQPIQSELHVRRENISSAYSNIPLKIMADFANKEGKVEVRTKLFDDANNILKDYPDLLVLESEIQRYISRVSNKSADVDWLVNSPLLYKVRHDHLHFSAKFKIGLNPRFSKGKRKRYAFDG